MVEIKKYYSRQIATLGQEIFHKVQNLHVFVSGLRGIGIECIKNFALSGVGEICIHDDTIVSENDLSTNYYLKTSDIGVKTRSQASLSSIEKLNPYIKISYKEGKIDEPFLSQFSVVVFADKSLSSLVQINQFCRTKNPPIGFVCSDSWGGFGYVFIDLGPDFITYDKTGEENKAYFISNITRENPGQVSVYDRHFLQDGNYVIFKEVQGMDEINNTPPRPVRVVNSFTFSIEDTTGYSAYVKEGIAEHFKIPEKFRFKSLEFNLTKPLLFADNVRRAEQLHIFTRAITEFVQNKSRLPQIHNEGEAEEIYQYALKINSDSKTNNGLYVEEVDKDLIIKAAKFSGLQLPPINSYFASIVTSEVIKFTGKYTPIMQWMSHDWFELFSYEQSIISPEIQNKLSNSKTLIVGLGALGSEVLKLFIQMGLKDFVIVDPGKIKTSDRHIFYSSESLGSSKVDVAENKVREKDENIKIKKELTDVYNLSLTDEEWNSFDWVICAVDNNKSRRLLDKKCVWYEKAMIEGRISNTLGSVHVYKPFETESYSESINDSEDQVSSEIILNFPYKIEHCIDYAKIKFNSYFTEMGNDLKSFLVEPNHYLSTLAESEKLRKMQQIYLYLELLQHNSYEECIKFAKEKFAELFFENIQKLLELYPQDSKDSENKYFWNGFKRIPTGVFYEKTEDLHLQFVEITAILLANTLGIQHTKVNLKDLKDSPHLVRNHSLEDLLMILSQQAPNQYLAQINAQIFDSEDSAHSSFVYSLSMLRARCYKISEIDQFSTEIIAGNINGYLPSTSTATAADICIELYRYLFKCNKNIILNQGTNSFVAWEPASPKLRKSIEYDPQLGAPVKAYPENFTVWDKLTIESSLTLAGLIQKFSDEFHLKINLVTFEKTCVYNGTAEGNEHMNTNIEDIFLRAPGSKALWFEVSCEEVNTGIEVVTPIIKYLIRN